VSVDEKTIDCAKPYWFDNADIRGSHREYLREVIRKGSSDNESEVDLARDSLNVLNAYEKLRDERRLLLDVLAAASAAHNDFCTMPWCRDKPEGDYTCVVTQRWKEFNFGSMHDLDQAITKARECVGRSND
jgi:hypothetical protein